MLKLQTDEKVAFLCVVPSIILISLIIFFPVIKTFISAFYALDLYGNPLHFAGFENFIRLFNEDSFGKVLFNTLIWTTGTVVLTVAISTLLALALNHEFLGRRFARVVLILPWASSVMISAMLWKWLFNSDYGMVNRLLSDIHIISQNIQWLANVNTSLPAMIFVGVLVSIPFTTITLLAGLQSIPNVLYEVARIDGASNLKVVLKITLPLLKDVFFIVTTLNVIYVFNSFPIIWVITRGNPADQSDIIITYLYKKAVLYQDFGMASAMSIFVFFILLVFSILYARLLYKKGE